MWVSPQCEFVCAAHFSFFTWWDQEMTYHASCYSTKPSILRAYQSFVMACRCRMVCGLVGQHATVSFGPRCECTRLARVSIFWKKSEKLSTTKTILRLKFVHQYQYGMSSCTLAWVHCSLSLYFLTLSFSMERASFETLMHWHCTVQIGLCVRYVAIDVRAWRLIPVDT